MNSEDAKQAFRLVAAAALRDGKKKLAKEEKKILVRFSKKLGVPLEEATGLLKEALKAKSDFAALRAEPANMALLAGELPEVLAKVPTKNDAEAAFKSSLEAALAPAAEVQTVPAGMPPLPAASEPPKIEVTPKPTAPAAEPPPLPAEPPPLPAEAEQAGEPAPDHDDHKPYRGMTTRHAEEVSPRLLWAFGIFGALLGGGAAFLIPNANLVLRFVLAQVFALTGGYLGGLFGLGLDELARRHRTHWWTLDHLAGRGLLGLAIGALVMIPLFGLGEAVSHLDFVARDLGIALGAAFAVGVVFGLLDPPLKRA